MSVFCLAECDYHDTLQAEVKQENRLSTLISPAFEWLAWHSHSGCAAFFLGSDMTGQEIFWVLCTFGEVPFQAESMFS